jgi:hypothetical protein
MLQPWEITSFGKKKPPEKQQNKQQNQNIKIEIMQACEAGKQNI